MTVQEKRLDELTPYENNPRNNDDAVEYVAASIRDFGFRVPIVIDNDGVIVAGHTRYKAAKLLGLDTVPTVGTGDLTEEQIKAFRLADNKTGELATWDFEKLELEMQKLETIDMEAYNFITYDEPEDSETIKQKEQEFRERMEAGEISEEDEEYQEFLEKFKLKKTTDDCYTPPVVYDAVVNWVCNEYKVNRKDFVRPFYPGGDYKNEQYKKGCVVVDNPPFSIISEICKFYCEKGIKFFLFAPSLTLFSSSSSSSSSSAIPCGCDITYENGANVATSFLTNLEDKNVRLRSAPTLYRAVQEANNENLRTMRKELPKYSYPDYIVTSTRVAAFSKYGVDFSVPVDESYHIRGLDEQKKQGKAIFGSAYLVSERVKAEKEKAEKEKAEKEKAEKEKAEKEKAERWQLSPKEYEIVWSLEKK